jgi:type II secretory pathway pseudopilin PulG
MRVMRRQNAPRGTAGRRGVSLLGILIGLAVIGIVACLAIPRFYSQPEITLDNAAVLLAKDLRSAQNWAARAGRDLSVVFEENGDGWRVVDEQDRILKRPEDKAPFRRVFSVDAVFEGVTIVHADFEGAWRVQYDRHGRATQGGAVVLEFGGERRTLTVGENSGIMSIEGLEREWVDDGL